MTDTLTPLQFSVLYLAVLLVIVLPLTLLFFHRVRDKLPFIIGLVASLSWLALAGCTTVNIERQPARPQRTQDVLPVSLPIANHSESIAAPYAPSGLIVGITMHPNGRVNTLSCKIEGATNGQPIVLEGTANLNSQAWHDIYEFDYIGPTNYHPCADLGQCNDPPDEQAFYRLRFPLE
jgi:hypothetical protein